MEAHRTDKVSTSITTKASYCVLTKTEMKGCREHNDVFVYMSTHWARWDKDFILWVMYEMRLDRFGDKLVKVFTSEWKMNDKDSCANSIFICGFARAESRTGKKRQCLTFWK